MISDREVKYVYRVTMRRRPEHATHYAPTFQQKILTPRAARAMLKNNESARRSFEARGKSTNHLPTLTFERAPVGAWEEWNLDDDCEASRPDGVQAGQPASGCGHAELELH